MAYCYFLKDKIATVAITEALMVDGMVYLGAHQPEGAGVLL